MNAKQMNELICMIEEMSSDNLYYLFDIVINELNARKIEKQRFGVNEC